uniref:Putative tigger transposable element n=1 Tax=Amblyomma sculptum TaxID=1581419 RepID=A0A1E1XRR1_AMBSC
MANRGKYTAKDLKTKMEILSEVERGVLSKTDIAKKYDIKKSTLSTYLRNKESISAAFRKDVMEPSRKRLRTSAHPEVESAVMAWIKEVRSRNIPLSGPIIAAKAAVFASQMGISEFGASEGWLSRFKARHGLTFRNVCGESAEVDKETCEQWVTSELKELLADYALSDVFNADETALYFKLLPNKTVTYKGDTCAGGKRSKERITVMMCANATGTERCRLLVIGKAEKPRCFKGIKTLPVDYTANKKSWMTREIFTDWLRKLDRKFAAQNRKVLMFVDNCTAHCDVSGLTAIRLAFLPKNTTSVLQPMDLGVIQNLKTLYRRHLLERLLLCLDSGKSYDIDLLGAVHMLASSWNTVKPETIKNCFRKCGFGDAPEACSAEVAEASSDDDSVVLNRGYAALSEGVAFEAYVDVDNGVETSGPLSDEDIITAACAPQGSRVANTAESDEESDEGDNPAPPPSACEVASALDLAARYFSADENSDPALELLGKLQSMLVESRHKKRKQTHITNYFSV